MHPAQIARLEPYPPAIELQLVTNKAHQLAIRTKVRYHMIGMAAATAAPALIVLNSSSAWLIRHGVLSEESITVAELLVLVGMVVLIFGHRHPTSAYTQARLKSELLRVHLHAFLARVGPHADHEYGPDDVRRLTTGIEHENTKQIVEKLIAIEEACRVQLGSGVPAVPDPRPFDPRRLVAYCEERVYEQEHWFERSRDEQNASYAHSARAFGIALGLSIVSVLGLLVAEATVPVAVGPLRGLLSLCSAAAAFILGARAVFGWDQKGDLYGLQLERIKAINRDLDEGAKRVQALLDKPTTPEVETELNLLVPALRRKAAAFEAWMSREACDFAFVNSRRFFDVGF